MLLVLFDVEKSHPGLPIQYGEGVGSYPRYWL